MGDINNPPGRKTLLLALLMGTSLAGVTSPHAATLEARTKIDKVMLYPDAAIITRTFSLDVPAGAHDILITDLPASLEPSSLRVEGSADTKLTLGGVDFRLAPNIPKAKPELELRIKALKSERDKLHDRIEAVETRKSMIQKMAQPSEGKETRSFEIESWKKAWDLIGNGVQTANDELRTLRIDETRLDEEITVLEAASAPQQGNQPKRAAAIAVESVGGGKANLTLSYRVRGAAWRPIYDARLDTRSTKPTLELVRRAMIRQNTGEDWTDASLTLSTVRVVRGTAPPELSGTKIAFYERPPARPMAVGQAAPAPEALAKTMMAEAQSDQSRRKTAASPPAMRIEEEQSTITASAYQTEFTVPGKIALPFGNEEKSVRLGSESFEPILGLKSAPVLDPTAYLDASFVLKGETPLLAGEVLLNRDGAYIGKGRIAQLAPGDKANLGFGADDRVKVTRVPIGRDAKEPGLFGTAKSDELRFRTDVKNLHSFSVDLQVLDRIPISEDQQITVERLADMTKPDQEMLDDKRGVFSWRVILKPQEARNFTTAYRIRWPATKEIHTQTLPQ